MEGILQKIPRTALSRRCTAGGGCVTRLILPVTQSHVVEPGIVGSLVDIAIHLEGHVDLVGAPGLGLVSNIHVVLYAIQGYGYVMGVGIIAIELPGQMVPLIGRRHGACNSRRSPCIPK